MAFGKDTIENKQLEFVSRNLFKDMEIIVVNLILRLNEKNSKLMYKELLDTFNVNKLMDKRGNEVI